MPYYEHKLFILMKDGSTEQYSFSANKPAHELRKMAHNVFYREYLRLRDMLDTGTFKTSTEFRGYDDPTEFALNVISDAYSAMARFSTISACVPNMPYSHDPYTITASSLWSLLCYIDSAARICDRPYQEEPNEYNNIERATWTVDHYKEVQHDLEHWSNLLKLAWEYAISHSEYVENSNKL